MEYRINKKTGDRISVLGFGTSYIAESSEEAAVAALHRAYESGVNYFDLATAHGKTFRYFGQALGSVRKNVFYLPYACHHLSRSGRGSGGYADVLRKSCV